jgi:hypothetical protein
MDTNQTTPPNSNGNGELNQLEKKLEDLFKQAPVLPTNIKEVLVQYAPYLIIFFCVIWGLTLLSALGLTGAFLFFYTGITGAYLWTTFIFTGLRVLLMVLAVQGLFKRSKSSWNLLFYANLVSLVGGIIAAFMSTVIVGSLVSTIIGVIVSLYFLFQIKEYYK